MKYILLLLLLFLAACAQEPEPEPENLDKVTAWAYKVDEIPLEPEPEPEEEIVTLEFCADDDKIDKFTAGKIWGFYNNSEAYEFTDECTSENRVMEFYCENGKPKQQSFFCRHGCAENHCL